MKEKILLAFPLVLKNTIFAFDLYIHLYNLKQAHVHIKESIYFLTSYRNLEVFSSLILADNLVKLH